MRQKLRQQLDRRKARNPPYPKTGLQRWLTWNSIQIPMTRGQRAKANREFKVTFDRVLTEVYAAGGNPTQLVVSADFKAAFDHEISMYP